MQVRIVGPEGVEKSGELVEITSLATGRSPVAWIKYTLSGCYGFGLNNGYGKSPLAEWRIHPEDLTILRDQATLDGIWVSPCGRSPGRRRSPKKATKTLKGQAGFGFE